MVENCEKHIKLEEKMNGKLGKTKEIEETVGKMKRKLWKNRGNAGKGSKKNMKWRQGKALKKLGR